jgi:hypothetical protein
LKNKGLTISGVLTTANRLGEIFLVTNGLEAIADASQ